MLTTHDLQNMQLTVLIGKHHEEDYFTRTYERWADYDTPENLETVKAIFEANEAKKAFAGDADAITYKLTVKPDYHPDCDPEYRENPVETYCAAEGQAIQGRRCRLVINELLSSRSSMSQLYHIYLKDNNLEDSTEEKAKYAVYMMNNMNLNDNSPFMNGTLPLYANPHPVLSDLWIKFWVPEEILPGEFECFDELKKYPRACIEKVFFHRYLAELFAYWDNSDNPPDTDFMDFYVKFA